MTENNYAVIMAGGIGSRFWPLSRSNYPKQFLDILNTGTTLIQQTFERLKYVCPAENILVVTNESYAPLVMEQLPELPVHNILKEPSRRNTAPCIAYAAHKIKSRNSNANILVSPSDHIVLKEEKFAGIINKGLSFVNDHNVLLTLGIRPSRPDTGYGYIQYIESDIKFPDIKKVKTFTEKPNKEIAVSFLKSGDFLWNSGMFLFNVNTILQAFSLYLPEMIDAFVACEGKYDTEEEALQIEKAYSLCTNISIDYGIMEKADNVYVIPADFGWSDVGTWGSIYDIFEKDYLGNAVRGKNVKIYNASNNMISANKNKLIVIEGIEGYCVIDTDDALLICKLENEQEIKTFTNDLKRLKLDQFL